MILDRHLVTVTGPLGELRLADGGGSSITLDATWSPYVRAQLVLEPGTKAVFESLDPRFDTGLGASLNGVPPRVTIEYRRVFTRAPQLDEISTYGTLDTISGTGATGTLDTIAHSPLNLNAATIADQVRTFDLSITDRKRDAEGRVTLLLASDEALAQDDAQLTAADKVVGVGDLRQLCLYVLERVAPYLAVSTFAPVLRAGGMPAWKPGVSPWDYLQPIVESYGGRLWCDESRVWHLDADTAVPDDLYQAVTISHLLNMVDWSDETTRGEDYADAIMVIYSWTDGAGVRQERYDISAPARYTRARVIRLADTVYPGPGAAARIAFAAYQRGRSTPLEAITNPTVRPLQRVDALLPTGELFSARIRGVTFHLDTAEMTITTKGA